MREFFKAQAPVKAVNTPYIVYVETNGDDATAEVGNPSKPFQTAQEAFQAAVYTEEACLIKFGVGYFGDIHADSWPAYIAIAGAGRNISALPGIVLTYDSEIYSDKSITIQYVLMNAVVLDGLGQSAHMLYLRNCIVQNVISDGASGENGQQPPIDSELPGGNGGHGGDAGYIELHDSEVNEVAMNGGSGGFGAQGANVTPGESFDAGIGGNGGYGGNAGYLSIYNSSVTNLSANVGYGANGSAGGDTEGAPASPGSNGNDGALGTFQMQLSRFNFNPADYDLNVYDTTFYQSTTSTNVQG